MDGNPYEQAIEQWGRDPQINQACQELAELIQALTKNQQHRFSGTEATEKGQKCINNIAEEIADVEIMLEELKIIYQNRPIVADWKHIKLTRLIDRLTAHAAIDGTINGVIPCSSKA